MKIKNKLIFSAVISILFIISLAILEFMYSIQVREEITKEDSANEFIDNIIKLNFLTEEYITYKEERMNYQWDRQYNTIKELIDESDIFENKKNITELLENARTTYNLLFEKNLERNKLIENNASQEEINRINVLEERGTAHIRLIFKKLITHSFDMAKRYRANTHQLMDQSNLIIFSFTMLLIIFIPLTTLGIASGIIKSIKKLLIGTEHLRDGNFKHTIQIDSKDETAILAEAFNEMTETIIEMRNHLEQKVEERTQDYLKAKEDAESASRAKSEFISNMSHELRTPLNAVLGFSEILSSSPNISAKQKKYLSTINDSGKHLLSLITDILDFGKIEANKMEIIPVEFDLKILLKQVFTINRIKAEEKGLNYYYKEKNSIPPIVKGDERKLKQILLNLLSNAVKYTQKGSVSLCVEMINKEHYSFFRFEVSDTGIGISKDQLEKIFEPFKQVLSDNAIVEGTGLGLTITKKLTELLHGRLVIVSEEGKGSLFVVELPLEVLAQNKIVEKTINTRYFGYDGTRKKILVIDDDLTNISVLVVYFMDLGFDIVVAESGSEGINTLSRSRPDIILLDLIMPGMDGVDFIETLRMNPLYNEIKIIGITAAMMSNPRCVEFIGMCDDFVEKPVDFQILTEMVGRVLQIDWILKPVAEVGYMGDEERGIIFPEPEVLQKIYEYVEEGDFSTLMNVLDELKNDNPKLNIFCEKIKIYAELFDDEKILTIIKPYLDRE